jgi:hypothetical protein
MDPNTILDRILELADIQLKVTDLDDFETEELAEAVQNLHEWLSRGGFLPKAWDHRDAREARLRHAQNHLARPKPLDSLLDLRQPERPLACIHCGSTDDTDPRNRLCGPCYKAQRKGL